MAVYHRMAKAWSSIQSAYGKKLIVSNTLSTCVLLGIGDVVTQTIEIRLSRAARASHSAAGGMSTARQLMAAAPMTSSSSSSSSLLHQTGAKSIMITGSDDGHDGQMVSASSVKKEPQQEQHRETYDWSRTAKVTCVGLLTGPFCHYWYGMLDRRFPSRSMLTILKKVFFDQLVCSPLCNVLFIFSFHTLDGKHMRQVLDIFKEKFLLIYAVRVLLKVVLSLFCDDKKKYFILFYFVC